MITRPELLSLLSRVQEAKVAVLGDYCVDAYWHLAADVAERSIETGLPVRRVDAQYYSLGGAGNVAANLSALGLRDVRAIGVRGDDVFGAALERLLTDIGVDVAGLHNLGPSWQTLVYAKPYRGATEEERFDFGARGDLPENAVGKIVDALLAACVWADAIVINQQVASCFAQPSIVDAINAVIAEHPETTFLVDARDAAGGFRGAVLKLNEREAGAMLGEPTIARLSSVDAHKAAARIMRLTGYPVFITRGERGIIAADSTGVHEILGVEVTTPTDPVGAGDTVVATIAAVLAAGGDVTAAAAMANLAASVTVAKMHTTGTASAAELERAATTANYVYEPDLAEAPYRADYLSGTEIEIVTKRHAGSRITHAIFDHDGTLSTLREGWERVMEPMMIGAILGDAAETIDPAGYAEVRTAVVEHIDRTTGVQTLVQMVGLVELVQRFGFVPPEQILDAHGYKAIYNAELLTVVSRRLAKLQSKQLDPQDFHVKGAVDILTALRDMGVTLYLASGTDVDDVRAEAAALGFAEFFGDQIFGAVGSVDVEAKRVVMDRLVSDLQGSSFVTFGDGPVEMRETRRYGGLAVGLCSDERRRHGLNPAKRRRLVRGGANVIVPDFSDLESLLSYLKLG